MTATAHASNASESQLTRTPAAAPGAAAWDIDTAHASAGFKVRHLMVSHVRGELGPVSGTLTIDDERIERSRVEVSIDARGLNSRDARRDEHLRSPDFLDVARYPTVAFRSTDVRRGQSGHLVVVGDLTIRDVTRSVTLDVDPLPPPVYDPWGGTRRGATARARINRKDWGLEWNVALETGGVLVGEKIKIVLDIEALKA